MAEMTKVAISSDFLTAFAALPRKIQGKVTEFINKFRNNPKAPGINYEKIHECIDNKICSVRIDDTYRGIVAKQEEHNVYLLLWVDHHDEAYTWAKRKRCEVNPKSGTLQVYDVQEIVEQRAVEGLFTKYADEDLLRLGIPQEQLSFVKAIATKIDLYNAKQALPQDAFEALSWLTEDIPIEEIIEMLDASSEVAASDDISKALDRPETMKNFVVVDGEEELRNIMAAPLEKWRVFLHPTQRKLVHKEFSGPARVLGGAGTGKTVVAMHRAKYLASKVKGSGKILFTTFTANLADDIKENLRKICTVEEMRKIEIINLDAWIGDYLRQAGYKAQVIYGNDELRNLWEEAITESGESLGLSIDFYLEEWIRVVVAQEAFSLPLYAKASRLGRGTSLDRKKRIAIWKVFDAYMNILKEKQVRDIYYATYECSVLINKNSPDGVYKHVIVDEGQDLSANAFKLLRQIAGETHENDIFIVGDAHQRIYKNKATLSKCGINVRGRSSILKINYRTTEEIRKAALALLQGVSFDDLDGDIDLGDKCQSLMHGELPKIEKLKDLNEEIAFVVNEINALKNNGVALNSVCVVARTHKLLEGYIQAFADKGIRAYEIKKNKTDNRDMDGIRVATMHRVKGLEFQYVFIVSVNNRIVPLYSAINHSDKVAEIETLTSEKCLLYVAMTRAQKGVYITCFGKPSEFLE